MNDGIEPAIAENETDGQPQASAFGPTDHRSITSTESAAYRHAARSVRTTKPTDLSFGQKLERRALLRSPGFTVERRFVSYSSIRSTTVAIPCPTPMHIVARP